ncbi:hypothetical protein PCASD_14330 [Puccinia coronata f. sp. avenae]|uniref:Uncharacterized protein n=1 Tax=Puccinia coronata f. sp. avenae TaxID=200324 RepID=A0A2N5U3R4_9BASI|nr:hypothetical protein PCASD_14330 [Puccinia coronata f. sp. avenae]
MVALIKGGIPKTSVANGTEARQQQSMSRNAVWVFGSNLFNQLDPDDRTNAQKKITKPRDLIRKERLKDAISFDILHVTDSQTLVKYTHATESGESEHLEIWGFDDEKQSTVGNRLNPPQKPFILHPVHQVKQWLGRTKILGYLARDGTIHPFNLNVKTSKEPQDNPTPLLSNPVRYRAVTISDNGEVLAAVLPKSSQTPDSKTEINPLIRLELWPSFQDLLDFCLDGVETHSKRRWINLPPLRSGETEIQLSSGASHFLILTHTPLPSEDGSKEEVSDYHSTLYAFGDNRFGQLGIGSRSVSVNEPQKIEDLSALSSIDCGLFHSLALGHDGELYIFGHNRKSQCGVGSSQVDTTTPILVDLGANGEAGDIIDVIDARCGSEHTVVLTSSGVWLAGSNDLGQLGIEDLVSRSEFQRNDNIPIADHPNTHSAWNIKTGRWNTFVWIK